MARIRSHTMNMESRNPAPSGDKWCRAGLQMSTRLARPLGTCLCQGRKRVATVMKEVFRASCRQEDKAEVVVGDHSVLGLSDKLQRRQTALGGCKVQQGCVGDPISGTCGGAGLKGVTNLFLRLGVTGGDMNRRQHGNSVDGGATTRNPQGLVAREGPHPCETKDRGQVS